MSNITKITDYSTNLSLLLEQYRETTLLKGLIDIMNDQADELEQALFEIRDEFWIETAIGVQLDVIGRILGIERKGMDDTTYRALLKARATIINSGEPEAIIALLKLLYEATYIKYWGSYPAIPAGFYLYTDAVVTIEELEIMSPAGVQPYLIGYLIDGNNTLNQIAQSSNFTFTLAALAIDDDYVYVGGNVTQSIKRYLKSDMSDAGSTPSLGGDTAAIEVDDTYLYVSVRVEQKIKKILKSDMTTIVAESSAYGGDIQGLALDDDYVYVGGFTTQTVKKLRKSDLVQVAESANYGGIIYVINVDGNFVYVSGATTQTIRKLSKSTLALVDESAAYGGSVYAMTSDDNHVYIGGSTVQVVKKFLKSTLEQVAESVDYGSVIQSLDINANHVYTGGASMIVSKKCIADLTHIFSSISHGTGIEALRVDDEYLYIGGGSNYPIRKLSKFGNPNYILDANTNKLFHVANP